MSAVSYNIAGAAEASGVSERTISDAIRRGDLIAHTLSTKPGSKQLILRRDLEEWVESLPIWEPHNR